VICCCKFTSPLSPRSAAYHRAHREHHLAAYPGVDAATRVNLDKLVEIYERGEVRAEERVS
jgi:hypothetical protein